MNPNGVRGSSTGLSMTSSRPSTAAAEAAAVCRRASLLGRAKVAGLQDNARDITLSVLCLSLGPLVYRRLGSPRWLRCWCLRWFTPHRLANRTSVSIILRSIRAPRRLRTAAGLDAGVCRMVPGRRPPVSEVTLRVAVLFLERNASGHGASLCLPLEQLRRPLIAVALGFFGGGKRWSSSTLEMGGHLARFLHQPRLNGVDPALGYGRRGDTPCHSSRPRARRFGAARLPPLGGRISPSLPPPPFWRRPAYRPRRRWPQACLFLVAVWLLPRLRWIEFGVFSDSRWLPCR